MKIAALNKNMKLPFKKFFKTMTHKVITPQIGYIKTKESEQKT